MRVADVAAAADENLAAHFTWAQARTAGMRAVLENVEVGYYHDYENRKSKIK